MRKKDDMSPDTAEATTEAAAPSVAAQASELLTVSALANKHGQTRKVREDLGDSPYSPEHMGADVLNGWARHKKFVGTEAVLSDADYLAAIEAAKVGKAHEPANKHGLTPPMEPAPDKSQLWAGGAK